MATAAPEKSRCPIAHDRDDRKTESIYRERVKFKDGAIEIRDPEKIKTALRQNVLLQDAMDAAAALESMPEEQIPLIFLDGKSHRERRKQITDYFMPKVIKEKFEPLMQETARRMVAELKRDGTLRVDEASWQMAVTLVGELIGVTRGKDHAGMVATAKRIEKILYRTKTHGNTGLQKVVGKVRSGLYAMDFLMRDVRPTIRARRKEPQDDVISRLIEQGYSEKAILIDTMTLCGAGMQTTREFISIVAWHLLDNLELRQDFLDGDYDRKLAILEEILRLEPIATAVMRRAPAELPDKAKGDYEAGASYILNVREANWNADMVGECPFAIDPDRKEKTGGLAGQGAFLAFGNGMHRCPGAPLALNETLVLMDHLLRVPGIRLVSEPVLDWHSGINGVELSNVVVACDPA